MNIITYLLFVFIFKITYQGFTVSDLGLWPSIEALDLKSHIQILPGQKSKKVCRVAALYTLQNNVGRNTYGLFYPSDSLCHATWTMLILIRQRVWEYSMCGCGTPPTSEPPLNLKAFCPHSPRTGIPTGGILCMHVFLINPAGSLWHSMSLWGNLRGLVFKWICVSAVSAHACQFMLYHHHHHLRMNKSNGMTNSKQWARARISLSAAAWLFRFTNDYRSNIARSISTAELAQSYVGLNCIGGNSQGGVVVQPR